MSYGKIVLFSFLSSTCLIGSMVPTVGAEEPAKETAATVSEYDVSGEEANLAVQAARALEKQMEQEPAKRIPEEVREMAKCIAVFPQVIEAGFIIAGKGGPGMVTCRDQETGEWGSPAVYNLSATSVGLQAGVQTASIILIYLEDAAVESLKEPEMSFGAGIDMQAGPVGASADTDALKDVAVLSYVRSKGLFAGINLEGASIRFIEEKNAELYGEEVTPEQVLFGDYEVPASAKALHDTLLKYAPPRVSTTQ